MWWTIKAQSFTIQAWSMNDLVLGRSRNTWSLQWSTFTQTKPPAIRLQTQYLKRLYECLHKQHCVKAQPVGVNRKRPKEQSVISVNFRERNVCLFCSFFVLLLVICVLLVCKLILKVPSGVFFFSENVWNKHFDHRGQPCTAGLRCFLICTPDFFFLTFAISFKTYPNFPEAFPLLRLPLQIRLCLSGSVKAPSCGTNWYDPKEQPGPRSAPVDITTQCMHVLNRKS